MDYRVLFSFLMHIEQFKVVACVENAKVVYYAFFCCFFEVFLRNIEQGFRNNVVSS